MIFTIETKSEHGGVLPSHARDGDVLNVKPDTSPPGNQPRKSNLVVHIDDAAISGDQDELNRYLTNGGNEFARSIWQAGEDPGVPILKHKHGRYANWRDKFASADIATILDSSVSLPDGELSLGGTVTDGIVYNLFTINDFILKQ